MKSWTEFHQAYGDHLRSLNRTSGLIQDYREALQGLERWGVEHPHEVTRTVLSEYFLALQQRFSARSAQRRLRLLLIPLRWGVRSGWLTFDPTVGLKPRKAQPKLDPVPSVEQIEALLEAPRQAKRKSIALRDLALLRLLYSTGLRSGELCRLDLVDAQMSEKLLRVVPGKGDERWLPITETVSEALEAYLERSRPRLANPQESALFVGLAGGRMTPEALRCLVSVYSKGTLSPHDLRRACATHLLEAGVPLVVIKFLLGHKDLSSTQIYAQVRPQELIREYRRTHPRFR